MPLSISHWSSTSIGTKSSCILLSCLKHQNPQHSDIFIKVKTSNCTSKDHCDKIKVLDPVVKDLISSKLSQTYPEEERPCLSKYWNGKIYFPNREISLALILFIFIKVFFFNKTTQGHKVAC